MLGTALLFMAINGAIWLVGTSLNNSFLLGSAISPSTTSAGLNGSINTLPTNGGFNTDFIFGDWTKPINTGWNLISGGYILNTLSNLGMLGLAGNFIVFFQMLVLFMTLGTVLYWFSGRQ